MKKLKLSNFQSKEIKNYAAIKGGDGYTTLNGQAYGDYTGGGNSWMYIYSSGTYCYSSNNGQSYQC